MQGVKTYLQHWVKTSLAELDYLRKLILKMRDGLQRRLPNIVDFPHNI